MKKLIPTITVISLLTSCLIKTTIRFFAIAIIATGFATVDAQIPIPKLTDRSKAGILSYFKTIVKNQQVIVGQQCSETPDVALEYKKNFQRLFDSTGKYPALIGLEYGYFDNINFTQTNQFAIEHWNKGGLVTINWSADNPWVKGYDCRWNSVTNKNTIDLNKLLKSAPGSPEKTSYRAELQKVAASLQKLKDAGVVVLWRPFHEMSAQWFWWGINTYTTSPVKITAYKALWKDMYDTFSKEYGLDNLLWVYAPWKVDSYTALISTMYPSDAYVDLVGIDDYSTPTAFRHETELKAFYKVVVNGEIGPDISLNGTFNEAELLHTFKGKAAYFLQWCSWSSDTGQPVRMSIIDNLKFKEMMVDSSAITLDKIK